MCVCFICVCNVYTVCLYVCVYVLFVYVMYYAVCLYVVCVYVMWMQCLCMCDMCIHLRICVVVIVYKVLMCYAILVPVMQYNIIPNSINNTGGNLICYITIIMIIIRC